MSTNSAPPSEWLDVLQLRLSHEYWDGPFDSYSLVPLPSTALACRNRKMVVRPQSGGFVVSVPRKTLERIITPAGQRAMLETTFCWEVRPTADEFVAVTEPAFAGASRVLVLTTGADRGGSRLSAQLNVTTDDLWVRRPLRFESTPITPPDEVKPVALHRAGEVQPALWVWSIGGRIPVDVSLFGSGAFQLFQDRRELDRWFADERMPAAVSAHPLWVMPGALMLHAMRTAYGAPEHASVPMCWAQFGTREIAWRYHIFTDVPQAMEIKPADDFDPATRAAREQRRPGAPWFVESPTAVIAGARTFVSTDGWPARRVPPARFVLNAGTARKVPLPLPATQPPAGNTADVFFRF